MKTFDSLKGLKFAALVGLALTIYGTAYADFSDYSNRINLASSTSMIRPIAPERANIRPIGTIASNDIRLLDYSTFTQNEPMPVSSEIELTAYSIQPRPLAKTTDCYTNACAGTDQCTNTCCDSKWSVYADVLIMRPRNVGITYGVVIDGPVVEGEIPIQLGRMGVVDPDFEPGFRVGFTRTLNRYADIGFSYSQLDTRTNDTLTGTGSTPIQSMVIHPSTNNADDSWLSATAQQDIHFKFADIDYRRTFAQGKNYKLRYLLGVRYGRLDQSFRSSFTLIGTEQINSGVRFDGGGFRLGIEGERVSCNSGLLFYGKASASFLAGEVRGRYFQGNSLDPSIVDTRWKEGRIVTIPELELGFGWRSKGGRLSFTCGYNMTAWMDTVKTGNFIQAIQENNYNGLNDKITFDGLVMRTEYIW